MSFLTTKGSLNKTDYKGIAEIAFGGLHDYIFKYFLELDNAIIKI